MCLERGSTGLNGRWRKRESGSSSSVVLGRRFDGGPVMIALMAELKTGIIDSRLWPRRARRSSVLWRCGMMSSGLEQRFFARFTAPYIRLLVTPGGWQECGGI